MISKQKISAIAKDINVPGKEIAKMLTEVAGITKSSAASVDAYEMSIIMEYYTQKFDDGTTMEEYVNAYQAKVEEQKKEEKAKKAKEQPVAVEELTEEDIASIKKMIDSYGK